MSSARKRLDVLKLDKSREALEIKHAQKEVEYLEKRFEEVLKAESLRLKLRKTESGLRVIELKMEEYNIWLKSIEK